MYRFSFVVEWQTKLGYKNRSRNFMDIFNVQNLPKANGALVKALKQQVYNEIIAVKNNTTVSTQKVDTFTRSRGIAQPNIPATTSRIQKAPEKNNATVTTQQIAATPSMPQANTRTGSSSVAQQASSATISTKQQVYNGIIAATKNNTTVSTQKVDTFTSSSVNPPTSALPQLSNSIITSPRTVSINNTSVFNTSSGIPNTTVYNTSPGNPFTYVPPQAPTPAPIVPRSNFNVAVIDKFNDVSALDVNGDGVKDSAIDKRTAHGNMVQAFIAANSKLPVHFIQTGTNGGVDKFAFDNLTAQIQSGKPIDAINSSNSLNLYNPNNTVAAFNPQIEDIANLLYPYNSSLSNADPLNVSNTQKYNLLLKNVSQGALYNPDSPVRQEVLNAFKLSPASADYINSWKKLVEAAQKRNIPIYVSASNEYGQINPLTLFKGVITVGAVDNRGKDAPYSSQASPVTQYAQGTYNIYETSTGYDFTGDGVEDISKSIVNLSGGESIAKTYDGTAYTEALNSASVVGADGKNKYTKFAEILANAGGALDQATQVSLAEPFKGQLFRTDQLIAAFKIAEQGASTFNYINGLPPSKFLENYSAEGNLVIFNTLSGDGDRFTAFRSKIDSSGAPVLFYDPANTGKAGAIGKTAGTSWATPVALIRDLNKLVA